MAGSQTDRDLLLGGHAIAGLPTKEFIALRSTLHHVRFFVLLFMFSPALSRHCTHPTHAHAMPAAALDDIQFDGSSLHHRSECISFPLPLHPGPTTKIPLSPEAKTRWRQDAMAAFKTAPPTGTARVPFLLLLLLVVSLRPSPIPAMTPSFTDKTANSSPTVYAACEMLTTTLPPPGPDTAADTTGTAAPAPLATAPPHHTETSTETETDAVNPSTPAPTPATRVPATVPSATPPLAVTRHEPLRPCSTRPADQEAAASRATFVEEAAAQAAAEDADGAGAGTTAETGNAAAT